ncbi:MAG: DUF6686 family protein [Bacteroidota bacterium]
MVAYCLECQTFHIYYGNVALDQSEAALRSLIRSLRANLAKFDGQVDDNCRCVEISTPAHGFRLVLSTKELREFSQILEKSYETFKHQRRLECYN